MGTILPARAPGPASNFDDKPRANIKARLLIWLLAGPILAALVGVIALRTYEARWSRALAFADRMNGVPAPTGPSLSAICADPVLAVPSCVDVTVVKALLVTASIAGVLGLALFGGLLDLKRRATGSRSRLLRAVRSALSLTIGAICVLLVLNAALVLMTVAMLASGRSAGKLVLMGAFIVIVMISGLVRLGLVVLKLRQAPPVKEVAGRRLRSSESRGLHTLVADVARRVGTAPPRHLIVGMMPNVTATQTPVMCAGETLTGRTLLISLPLCRVLRVDELASIIGHELGHFKGGDTEFSESIDPIYRGVSDTLTALTQAVNDSKVHSFVLRPALYAFELFLDALHESEVAIRRDREHSADQAAVTASDAHTAAAALVKVQAFSPVWDDIDAETCRLAEAARRVENLSTLFAERAAKRSAVHAADSNPLASLLEHHPAHASDGHPPLGTRLTHIGVTLEEIRDRALDVAPAEAASGLVDDLESIERRQSAALRYVSTAMASGAGAGGGSRAWSRWPSFQWIAAGAVGFAFAFGFASFRTNFFPRTSLAPTPAAAAAPLPLMPEVPSRAALLALLRDRRFDDLERELADAVRRSRESPRDEIIATTAFRTFWIADATITPLLDEWVGRAPDSLLALLARARHAAALGWAARGTESRRETSSAQFAGMEQHHARARFDLYEALKRDPKLVEAHAELIQLAKNDGINRCEAVGATALHAAPASYRLRALILGCLEPRWGGSHERMRAFAIASRRYARENPQLSALTGYVEMDFGRTLAWDDRDAEAIGAYTMALSHGQEGTFYHMRALAYAAVGDHKRALADIDAALTLVPHDPEMLADRARSLDKLGRPAEALASFALAQRIDPSNEDVRQSAGYFNHHDVIRGHNLVKEGVTEGAARAFDATIQADPTNAEAFYWRGRSYLKSGDLARALEDFQRAMALDPTHFDSCRNVDYLLARQQRWDEIIALWTAYLALKPDDGKAYLERAGAARRKGDMTQAFADVRRACELGNAEACAIARTLPAGASASS